MGDKEWRCRVNKARQPGHQAEGSCDTHRNRLSATSPSFLNIHLSYARVYSSRLFPIPGPKQRPPTLERAVPINAGIHCHRRFLYDLLQASIISFNYPAVNKKKKQPLLSRLQFFMPGNRSQNFRFIPEQKRVNQRSTTRF